MATQDDKETGASLALNALRSKAKLNKDRHFAAAERKGTYQTWAGLPVVLMNIFVGTVLFRFLQDSAPPIWASALATVLAFLGASLSAIQAFFNFSKASEGHRAIANRYLDIAMQCEQLMLRQCDQQFAACKIWERVDQLRQAYTQINTEAEAFPTNLRDFKKAKGKEPTFPFKLPQEELAKTKLEGKDVSDNAPGKKGKLLESASR